jgi:hypothetical protein
MTSDTFLIPTTCTMSIMYVTLMRIFYMFRCLCTIIRENNMIISYRIEPIVNNVIIVVGFSRNKHGCSP